MNLTKNYDGKELTIIAEGKIDTVTAPDFEVKLIQ